MTKEEFYVKWLDRFAADIPKSKIEKYVRSTGNYIWHVFSWELLGKNQYAEGDAARKAYDQADKEGAQYIVWFEEDHTKALPEELAAAKALEKFVEVYAVGKDFAWTYIQTHEGTCGPYFLN